MYCHCRKPRYRWQSNRTVGEVTAGYAICAIRSAGSVYTGATISTVVAAANAIHIVRIITVSAINSIIDTTAVNTIITPARCTNTKRQNKIKQHGFYILYRIQKRILPVALESVLLGFELSNAAHSAAIFRYVLPEFLVAGHIAIGACSKNARIFLTALQAVLNRNAT